ncbi:MAG TPA: hypothetical protein VNN07_00850 [Candidatus Tectomicrobia bacterium]|nr:hypothetical protein [Candidatus Tectomicrobia bacterium]
MERMARLLGVDKVDWSQWWRSADFWLAMATLLLPFGFLLLVFRLEPVRVRIRRR